MTRILIENGANWRATSGEIDGLNTALHLAAAFGRESVKKYLAEVKQEMKSIINKRGHTAEQLEKLLWNSNNDARYK